MVVDGPVAGIQVLGPECIAAGLIHMHGLKPINRAAVLGVAASSGALLTVGEHSVYGRLGATRAPSLMEA